MLPRRHVAVISRAADSREFANHTSTDDSQEEKLSNDVDVTEDGILNAKVVTVRKATMEGMLEAGVPFGA